MTIERNEELVNSRIANDLKDHVITVKHATGMYRHWRCQKPGTWNMGFDIVTWPGSLCYTGDMGDYLFQRTDDMAAFMANACRDRSYSAEKCVAGRDQIKEWSEQRFREVLAERLKESEDGMFTVVRGGRTQSERIGDKTREIVREFENYSSEHDATKAMYESGLWDGCDMPSCQVYSMRFLWCLKALEWFCDKLAREATRSSDVLSSVGP